MSPHRQRTNSRGTVSLVALCLVAVLGIALASYLAVCSRAMNLSNRAYQEELGRQLAEFGLEEGLRAFNKNDWSNWASNPTNVSAGAWTLDATNRRASRSISFQRGKLAQGATATVKIRVDNYDAARLGVSWSSSAPYQMDDVVGYNGTWYRCIRAHSNIAPPNPNYWMPEGVPWKWSSAVSYRNNDLVAHGGTWYRSREDNNNNRTPPSSSWRQLVSIYTTLPASPYVSSGQEALFISGTNLVQLTNNSADYSYPYMWIWRIGVTYSLNDVVFSSGVWWRCLAPHTSSWWPTNNTLTNTSLWARIDALWAWDASTNYNIHDVVYSSSAAKWYRCIRANINQAPSDTSVYWANTPLYPTTWSQTMSYRQNDVVRHNGVWYLSLQNTNVGRNPATATTYWIAATTTNSSYTWNSTTNFSVGSYRCYGGVWYRCTAGSNRGISPNHTSYWTPTWANSSGVTHGAPVLYAEATITLPRSPAFVIQLRATLAPSPLFPNAVAASEALTINGGGSTGTIDSYDGSGGYTYGQTTTPFAASPNHNVGFSAVVASGGASFPSMIIGSNTTIKGYVDTRSTAAIPSLASFANNAALRNRNGTVTSPHPSATNVDLTRISRNGLIPQFTAQSAITQMSLPTSLPTILNLGTSGGISPSVYTYTGNLVLGTGRTININGPVILDVVGNFQTNSGGIVINSGGSLELHVSGRLQIDAGSNGFDNKTSNPKNLNVIVTGNSGAHHYRSTAQPFYGTIYLPNNSSSNVFTIGAGVIFHGALSAKNILFADTANVRYDTSLRHATISGVDQPYAVTEWRELPVTERATMP